MIFKGRDEEEEAARRKEQAESVGFDCNDEGKNKN